MKLSTLVLAATVAVTGCAAPITSDVRITDVAPEDLRIRELAMLPAIVDPGLEGIGQEASQGLYEAIVEEQPSVSVLPAERALERMNQAGVASAYAHLVGRYEEEGELDAEIVREIADAVGVQYLLNLRLMYGEEEGLARGEITGDVGYTGQSLRAVVQLWDGRRGTMLWRTLGDVSSMSSDLMREREVGDLIAEVMPQLAERLPVEGGQELAEAPEWQGPDDDSVFMGASGLILLAFLLL